MYEINSKSMLRIVLYSSIVSGCDGLSLRRHGEPKYDRCDTEEANETQQENVSEAVETDRGNVSETNPQEGGSVESADANSMTRNNTPEDELDAETEAYVRLQMQNMEHLFGEVGIIAVTEEDNSSELQYLGDNVVFDCSDCLCNTTCNYHSTKSKNEHSNFANIVRNVFVAYFLLGVLTWFVLSVWLIIGFVLEQVLGPPWFKVLIQNISS